MNGGAVMAEILKREGTEFLAALPFQPLPISTLIEECAKLDSRLVPSGACRQHHRRRVKPNDQRKANRHKSHWNL